MDYAFLKHVHMALALLSIGGFVLRWCWRMMQSPLALKKLTRIVPHLVDTLFLGTALLMLVQLGQVPISHGWLTAKISGLVLYIVLGMIAMRTAPEVKRSLPAFVAAVLVFAWIVTVAISKTPLGFLQPA